MNLAYADPPYFGQGKKHYAAHHPEAAVWDTLETHARLIDQLRTFDGWALSCTSGNLFDLLPLFGEPRPRIAAWVKPFASFKPGVSPAYTWEPVIFLPARPGDRSKPTVRDHLSANITLRKGLTGAKPAPFADWIFNLLRAEPEDTLTDMFPGTGIITAQWALR